MRCGRGIAIAVAALFLLGLVGCGGGGGTNSQASVTSSTVASGGEATSSEATLTKAEWVERGNEVCNELIDKKSRGMEAFYKARGVGGTPNQHQREAMNAAVVLPNVQERIDELEALPVPPGQEGKIRAILRSMEQGIHETEAHPENLAEPKQPIPFAESEHLAGGYGLLFCGMP
jgi:hypothetical protein